MIGCGFPDQHADALAANLSLISSIRSHVYRGRRIYSEGGGTAYLGRIDADPTAGRSPASGSCRSTPSFRPTPPRPEPVSCTLRRDTWLGPRGPWSAAIARAAGTSSRPRSFATARPASAPLSDVGEDFFYHHHAVGSLVHLHLAALPQVVAAFAGPHRPIFDLAAGRAVTRDFLILNRQGQGRGRRRAGER